MNRLPTLLAPSVNYTDRQPAAEVSVAELEYQLPIEHTHRVFYPHNFTPSYDYPLVVWLHSDRSSEMEVMPVMDALSDQNYLAICPRANIRCRSQQRLFRWGDTRMDYAFAEDAVWECILGALEYLPVAADKIFLAGFGQGGTLAQWIGLQYADRFSGVVSFSGAAPTLGGALSNWKQSKELPMLFMQRQGSTLCTEDQLEDAMRMSYRAGLNCQFLQLQSDDDSFADSDELSTAMLAAANRFMMGIVTGSPISLEPEPRRDHLVGPFGVN